MRHNGPKSTAFPHPSRSLLDSPAGPCSERPARAAARPHRPGRASRKDMTSFRSRWVCTALAAALTAAAGTAGAQGVVKNTFGDWQMRCETPPGAKSEQCALVQNVMAEDRPNLTLLVIALRIDQADIGRAGYVRCLTTGCIAEAVLDDTLLNQLKGGQTATFIVFQTPEEGVGVPVSLNGFGAGFDGLP